MLLVTEDFWAQGSEAKGDRQAWVGLSRRAGVRKARSCQSPRGVSTLALGQRHNFRSQESLEIPLQGSSEVLLTLEPERPEFKPQP